VHPVCGLQSEYSLLSRGIEAIILSTCRERGIGLTVYGVLSRGLQAGSWDAATKPGEDMRSHLAPIRPGNLEHNLGPIEALGAFAHTRGAAVAQCGIFGDGCAPAQMAHLDSEHSKHRLRFDSRSGLPLPVRIHSGERTAKYQ
jgi:hypothetical protein